PSQVLIDALSDDLNTHAALTELHRLAGAGDGATLQASAALLGLLTPDLAGWEAVEEVDLSDWVHALGAARATAMETKDFAEVDAMKARLTAAGVEVRMSKAGVDLIAGPDFDAAKL
ncbi:MAG: cysteine--tRNA ligase, partial [Pseudomonadota bacterium]